MKHNLRNPTFLCKKLDNGNVCPACPKVNINTRMLCTKCGFRQFQDLPVLTMNCPFVPKICCLPSPPQPLTINCNVDRHDANLYALFLLSEEWIHYESV